MKTQLPSKNSNKLSIKVKSKKTLEEYKEIVYLTRSYYNAMINSKPLPKSPLPSIHILLESTLIVDAYLKASNFGLSIKLFNACLETEKVIAVWLFANESTLNIRLGDYQLLAIKHN